MFEALIVYLKSQYEIEVIKKDANFSADGLRIGHPPYEPWHKPEFLYVTLNFCGEKSWTNQGGYKYCECQLTDKSKILINWDHSTNKNYENYEKFDIKIIRKLKLKKLNLIYT